MRQSFDLPWTPVAKQRPRVGRGHAYTPQQTKNAEESLGWLLRAKGAQLYAREVPLSVRMVFRCGKGTGWRVARPDVDNLVKLVGDSANGILWSDDAQIVELHASKECGGPGLLLEVGPAEGWEKV
ncbi:MAG: RusA family crossover junction endodeoxyribonuclease [Actinomycetota bacterium]|nr:RusA family crossover junction endodeoxyribonuclease [Actinomycetota bacterium]